MTTKHKGKAAGSAYKVCTEYLDGREAISHAGAARVLYNKHPELWPNLESCRIMVRRIRGKQGTHHRRAAAKKDLHETHQRSCAPVPKMPESIKRQIPFDSLNIDVPGDWAVFSDVHVPFHDERAIEAAVKEAKRRDIKGVLLNGDIADFYRISQHVTDPRVVDLWDEIQAVRSFLEYIRAQFPKAEFVYNEGNHEVRATTWFLIKAPELLDIPDFQFEQLMRLKDHGIAYNKDKRPIRLGKLNMLHGHELRSGLTAPVNPARGLFLRVQDNCMQGHCHRTSHHAEMQPLTRHLVSCFSTGCLCQLDAAYDPINKWNHGFAVVNVGQHGEFGVSNYRIIDGKCYS